MAMKIPPSVLQTPGFAHYSVAWSPFHPNRLAVASSANFGLVGNGRLHLVGVGGAPAPGGPNVPSLTNDKYFATQDGLFDVAWSECHENQLVTSSGDGSLKLWDATLKDLPIRVWKEHTREAYSVDWSNLRKDMFMSSSWDGTVKMWLPDHPRSLHTIHAHSACVYQALFSPHHPSLVMTCSADGSIRLFDTRSPLFISAPTSVTNPISKPSLIVPRVGNGGEILTVDWNKYRQMVVASAGVDGRIRVWDWRMVRLATGDAEETTVAPAASCEAELPGHEYAVRRVQWNPHSADVLASASYDMTCRVWSSPFAEGPGTNTAPPMPPRGPALKYIHDLHTEFVVGCAWSLFEPGVLASCSWDSKLHVFRI